MGLLKEMLLTILEMQPSKQLLLSDLAQNFLAHYRLVLLPDDLGFAFLEELLSAFPEVCLVQAAPISLPITPSSGASLTGDGPNGGRPNGESRISKSEVSTRVCLASRGRVKQVAYRCLQLLFNSPYGSMTEAELKERYRASFDEKIDFDLVQQKMGYFIQA